VKVKVGEYTRDSAARAAIEEGDLVMFRGGPLHDRVIEIGTCGIYCHAALAYLEPDPATGEKRIYLVQATKAHGVNTSLVSDEVAGFEGAMEHWRIKLPHLAKYDRKKATAQARTKVGLPYAMTPIYMFALDFITFRLFDLRAKKIDPKAWFCSELVAWAAREGGGVDLDTRHVDAATAPSDLVTHRRAECLGAFAHPDVIAKAKG
jgi:hypothetical protein